MGEGLEKYLQVRLEKAHMFMQKYRAKDLVVATPEWTYYFTGIHVDTTSPSVLVIEDTGVITLIASEEPGSSDVRYLGYPRSCHEDMVQSVSDLVGELTHHYTDTIMLSVNESPDWLVAKLVATGKDVLDAGKELALMRAMKDEHEIQSILRTLELNCAAYECLMCELRPGLTELEIQMQIVSAFEQIAVKPVVFMSDIISGPRTSTIGGKASTRILEREDTLIVDISPQFNGYFSDTTRTFILGEPSKEHVSVYNTLLKAMEKTEQYLRPGIRANDVYAHMMKAIDTCGYGEYFPHHAGHGIGLSELELPQFIEQCSMELMPGMVVTLEPGVYLPGDFGMRIENNYLVTSNGVTNLFNYPRCLDSFAIT